MPYPEEPKDIFWLMDIIFEWIAGAIIFLGFLGWKFWLNIMGLTITK